MARLVGMQRCPYIHEMRERLLAPNQAQNARTSTPDNMERQSLISSPQRENNAQPPMGTVVKVSQVSNILHPTHSKSTHIIHPHCPSIQLSSDGFGSYISPTHQQTTPLVPRDLGEDFTLELIDDERDPRLPKNAK